MKDSAACRARRRAGDVGVTLTVTCDPPISVPTIGLFISKSTMSTRYAPSWSHAAPRVRRQRACPMMRETVVTTVERIVRTGIEEVRRRPKTTESEPPPVMPSRLESADSHGGREHDACFSSMPRSRRRLLRGLPGIEISQSPEGQNSLVAGKKAGNLFDLAVFCENSSGKHLLIQSVADEFPTRTEQGIFLPGQGIILASREWQGISAHNRSARPDASDSANMRLRDG